MKPEDRIWVRVDAAWMEMFETLRKLVMDRLVNTEIVVESCPTSNLVVANLDRPPLAVLVRQTGLLCAIATDDPGLLGAWPGDELRHADGYRERLLAETRRASFVRLV